MPTTSPPSLAQRHAQSIASSSPGLPSLEDIAPTNPARSTRLVASHSVEQPATTETLYNLPDLISGNADSPVVIEIANKRGLKTRKPKQPKVEAPKKARAKSTKTKPTKDDADDANEPPKKTRKPRATGAKAKKDAASKGIEGDEDTRETSPHFPVANVADDVLQLPPKKTRKPRTTAAQKKHGSALVSVEGDAGPRETSPHFPAETGVKAKAAAISDPLDLEPALPRKVLWTPPKPILPDHVNLVSSQTPEALSSTIKDKQDVFGQLLDRFGCDDEPAQPALPDDTDHESSFLKKRKLIELVGTGADGSEQAAQDKPAAKKKVPKKPRTITALAMAAYKPATQPDAAPTGSLLNYFPKDGQTSVPAEATDQAKPKKRKKAAKSTKKKVVPPKPILLSPNTALKQVADQNFVFGTSSQLAREQSPTFWRDVQAAVKDSKALDFSLFDTPLNSDAIEPADVQSKLWTAGARDAEGELLHLEVIDLAQSSPQLPRSKDNADPYGYLGAEAGPARAAAEQMQVSQPQVAAAPITFQDVYETIGAPKQDQSTVKGPVATSEVYELSDTPIKPPSAIGELEFPDVYETITTPKPTVIERPMEAQTIALPADKQLASEPIASTKNANQVQASQAARSGPPKPTATRKQPKKPSYGLYTDLQLSREIKKYGFKPVKRRNAMIALLDQCWQSKAQAQITSGARAASSAAALETPSQVLEQSPVKQGVDQVMSGDDASDIEIQEPPPSAQPPPSPKRGPGRPRKDSASTPSKPKTTKVTRKKATTSTRTTKATSPRSPRPRGRPPKPKLVLEIADSASDDDEDLASSRGTSPDTPSSSPIAADMSLTMDGDDDLSLVVTPPSSDTLFGLITRAVTTAPGSTDPQNPSWHEKMLLYDPIVLEDLTAWLNSGQLTRAGYDGEVSPGEVKQWCESKSVCCLWRVNLRGKERKRY